MHLVCTLLNVASDVCLVVVVALRLVLKQAYLNCNRFDLQYAGTRSDSGAQWESAIAIAKVVCHLIALIKMTSSFRQFKSDRVIKESKGSYSSSCYYRPYPQYGWDFPDKFQDFRGLRMSTNFFSTNFLNTAVRDIPANFLGHPRFPPSKNKENKLSREG